MSSKIKNYALVLTGGLVFGLTINLFIMPLGLYNGGFTGIAQIMSDWVIKLFDLNPEIKIAGFLTFLINLPVFIFAFNRLSRNFVMLSLFTIVAQTLTMSITPIPQTPLIQDVFVNLILAAFIGGWGVALAFRGKGSAGGLDIIGIYQSQNKKGSVGTIYLIVNALIYLYCFVFYDFETAMYSLIYSTIFAFVIDKFHHSNIEVSVMVFTRNPQIKAIINSELVRGATHWEGYGSYTGTPTEIFISVVSQEEVPRIKKIIYQYDPNAFVIIHENLKVVGGFEKRLI
ncbi:MAG TPA: YitT family protein [Erysipelothrix sp.]|nr:YitT family protein [Erysipelothrix sp.]